MDVRQLRYLVAVVDERGFAKAAERLHVAQSALSRQIQTLEEEIGVRLLERNRRSTLRLTEAGTLFLPAARSALDHFERAERVGRRLGRGEVGRVKIGYVASAVFSGLLASVGTAYRARSPDVEIEVSEMESPRQIEALADGEIDIGFFRPQPAVGDDVETLVMLREPVILALPRDHPLAAVDRPLAAHELAGDAFVVPLADDEAGFSRHVAAIAERGGFPLRISHHVPDFVSVLNLVGLGFGVAAVPACLERVRPAEIVYRRLADLDLRADLAGGFRRDERSPAVAGFVAVMRRRAAEIAGG
jgi:DNA-binding transcriptional LysR family regulator